MEISIIRVCIYLYNFNHHRTSAQQYEVRLGEHDLSIKEGPELITGMSKIIIHERFSPDTVDSDLALIKLDQVPIQHSICAYFLKIFLTSNFFLIRLCQI